MVEVLKEKLQLFAECLLDVGRGICERFKETLGV